MAKTPTRRSATSLSIALLGDLRLAVDGKPHHIALRPKATELLTYLLLHRTSAISRDTLAFQLWPDEPEEKARSNLRRHLYLVREALPVSAEPWILVDGDLIRWNPAAVVRLDVDEFRRLAERGDPHAVELYAGDLLEQSYDDWLRPHREQLRSLYLETLWKLATDARERRDPARAKRLVQRILASEPLREDAVRALMSILHEQRNRSGALDLFDQFERRLRDELAAEPMRETLALRDTVLQDLAPAPLPTPHNLPAWSSTFVGRGDDVARITDLVRQHRLISIVGPGGVGKTRTAVQLARDLLDRFPDGVWFVDLAAVAHPSHVSEVVAAAVGASDFGERPVIDGLIDHLKKRHVLIVLDNCEHVIAEIAPLGERVLRACTQVSFLATSRERLRISDEVAYRLPPLSVPASDAALSPESAIRFGSVSLFVDRAVAVDRAFRLTDETTPSVAQLCRRLDGIPLAIELVAARIASIDVRTLADRLEEWSEGLAGGSRTTVKRHRTLRALIDWTYDLLTDAERWVFRRVAIFAGGWTLESARAVLQSEVALERHASLVEKSLIVADLSGSWPRYRLLHSTRAYALERMAQDGEINDVSRRHAAWMGNYADRAFDAVWKTPHSQWLASVKPEWENAKTAITWSLEAEASGELAGRIVGGLIGIWILSGLMSEGRRLVEAALDALGSNAPPAVEARLRNSLCIFVVAERQVEAAERAINLYEQLGDPGGLAEAHQNLAIGLTEMGRLEEAKHACDTSLELFREADRQISRRYAHTLVLQARILKNQGRLEGAYSLLSEAIELWDVLADEREAADAGGQLAELEFAAGRPRAALDRVKQTIRVLEDLRGSGTSAPAIVDRLLAPTLSNAAAYHLTLGNIDEAHSAARASLNLLAHGGDSLQVAWVLQILAGVALYRGELARAVRLQGYVDAWALREGYKRELTEQRVFDIVNSLLRDRLAPAQIERLAQIGASVEEDQAIAEALAIKEAIAALDEAHVLGLRDVSNDEGRVRTSRLR